MAVLWIDFQRQEGQIMSKRTISPGNTGQPGIPPIATCNVSGKPQVRCAIYTRKSTEEGLQQEFNTLDAQRESAEAYIKSQVAEGWVCLDQRFDDGGFTGGNMDRPALKRLL